MAQALPKRSVPTWLELLFGAILTQTRFVTDAWLAISPRRHWTSYYKMKNIGKPCAGEPHARFDEGELVDAVTEKLFDTARRKERMNLMRVRPALYPFMLFCKKSANWLLVFLG